MISSKTRTSLNVLILGESVTEVDLLITELLRSGFDVSTQTIDNEADFIPALDNRPDVILAHYSFSRMDPHRALALLQEHGFEIPLIVVNVPTDDDAGRRCMELGAADYLHKDHLESPGDVVRKAIERQHFHDLNGQIDPNYRLLFETNRDILLFVRLSDGQILEANPAAVVAYGYARNELLELTINALCPAYPNPEATSRTWEECPQGVFVQATHRRKDGSEFPVEINATRAILRGQPVYLSVVRDISSKLRTEKDLRDTHQLLERTFDSLGDVILVQDPTTRIILRCNQSAQKVLGYAPHELVGTTTERLFENREDYLAFGQLFYAELDRYGFYQSRRRLLRKDGQAIEVEIRITELHDEKGCRVGFVGTIHDITEQVRSDDALRESEERYRQLVEQSPEGIGVFVNEWLTYANPAGLALLRADTPEQAVGISLVDLIHPEDLNISLDKYRQVLVGEAVPPSELKIVRLDGSTAIIETKQVLIARSGNPAVMLIARDITEKKATEAALLQREQDFRSIVENSGDGIVISDNQGVIREWNKAMEDISGLSQDTVVERELFDVQAQLIPDNRRSPELIERIKRIGRQLLNGEDFPEKDQWMEMTLQRPDGQLRQVLSKHFTLAANDGIRLGGIFRDITELRRAEMQVRRQAQEFATLYETTLASTDQRDMTRMVNMLLERVTTLMGVDYAFISLYHPLNGQLQVIASRGAESLIGLIIPISNGVSGRVATSLHPLTVDNYQTYEYALPEFAAYGFSSVVAVPLHYTGELIGVLTLAKTGAVDRVFTEKEINLLSMFGSIAASAIHNARLFDEVNQHANHLVSLYEAGLAINSMFEPHAQLEKLFEVACKMLLSDQVLFFRYNAHKQSFHYDMGVGIPGEIEQRLSGLQWSSDATKSVVGWVGTHRKIYNSPDIHADPRVQVVDKRVHSGIWVAIQHGESLLGVITILREREEAFTAQEERLLEMIANQAGVAMENARLFQETQHQFRYIQSLWSIDQAILGSVDLEVIMNVYLQSIASELEVDAMNILYYSAENHTLKTLASRGMPVEKIHVVNQPVDGSFIGLVAAKREVEFIQDLNAKKDILPNRLIKMGENFTSYVALPLVAKGELQGVMELCSRTRLEPNDEWFAYLQAFANQGAIAIENARLFEQQQRANQQLMMAYEATIEGWSQALDLRDKETEGHSQRVTQLTLEMAAELGVDRSEIPHYRRGALLHDIGKMGIPDQILLKPGPLTDEEWDVMRQHPELAYNLLSTIEYLRPALNIPYCHHEKWDGSGYPRGLAGEQIPLSARIFAVADVWDALTSDRPYRDAWSRQQALRYIHDQSGKHFDPMVVSVFKRLVRE